MTAPSDSAFEPLASALPIAARLAAARAQAATGLTAGQSGVELAANLTFAIEGAVLGLAEACFAKVGLGPSSGLALLATGGFGRREFAPYSDLDLLFLHVDGFDRAILERVVGSILRPLDQAHLDAGHAVRSVKEALELPRTDLTAATALLDLRFLVGDRALGDRFQALYGARVGGSSPDGFVGRLRAEQHARHSKFGDTIFLLEPDLKSGPGGIRDMCAGRWAAQARYTTGDPEALRDLGHMSPRQAAAFEQAREWFLRVRIALHLQAGRKLDRLGFEMQEKLGPMLYGHVNPPPDGDVRPAVAPSVEALMHQFQRHAKTISRETARLMSRAAADSGRNASVVPVSLRAAGSALDNSFELRDGAIEVKDPTVFERKPSQMFRLFSAAIELDVSVGLLTADLIADLAPRSALALRGDPDSARWFLDVLTDVRDRAAPSRLEQMNDLGLLGALMPEWEPVNGRVQHDVYHVYTVDQHSLYAVALLKALARGDRRDDYPRPHEAMRQVRRSVPLYLATLLHDVGKTLGRNHSLKGAVVGRVVAARLGLDPGDVKRVEALILHHLVMGHVSQRRDLADLAQIGQMARIVGANEDALRELYLLTFCDQYCIGPGNLTAWKDDLLNELYLRTLTFVRRGPDLLAAERAELVKDRRAQAAAALGGDAKRPEMTALLASLPDRYFVEKDAAAVAEHARVVGGRVGACAVHVGQIPGKEFSELVLVADDVPGLLANATGVLFANRIDILDAAIYSREAPAPGGRGGALDVFFIRRAGGGAVTDEARITRIRRDMEAVLSGVTTVEELLAARPVPTSILDRAKPQVPETEVKVDNEVSPDFTIIDVYTQDRPGVLHAIATVLHRQQLDIHRSKIATEADRVADIFYVRDQQTGAKILDPGRISAIRDALRAALPTR